MPESANPHIDSSGPSLEQILWRAMDRWEERPALVDADEFAAHIEEAFDGDLPAESWVARFFEGEAKLHGKAPSDMAEAIVRATKERLHVYEFDLNKLEYVIVEDEEKVVVVSDFGQFALRNDDTVTRAIESAVIPKDSSDRGSSEPKAYFVRSSGEVVAVDVKKVARSLESLLVKQVSMPAVQKPGTRLLPFAPARRKLTEAREAQALRQDARGLKPVPPAPRLDRTRASDAPPAAAPTAVFVLMPDGTLARPEIGSATRWQDMLGQYARSAASAVPVTQRMFLQTGNVVAVINSTVSSAGERAMARGESLSAVRGGMALPVKILGDDELAKALANGAKVAPGFGVGDRFWVQPEAAFKPDLSKLPEMAPKNPALVATPLQLGEITGDPWADWALTGGGQMPLEVMMAMRGRSRSALRAALDRPDEIPPELAEKLRGVRGKELMFSGAPVVGFRAADGSIVMQSARGAVRLAALDRPDGMLPLDLQLPAGGPIAARSGALPATALAALQMALEHTANAGGFQLPMMRIVSAPDALDVGAAMDLPSFDERRTMVRLAGAPSLYDGGAGNQVAQLVLSMPFPNQGEVHVGSDLAEALQAYLGGQVQPASGSLFAPSVAAGGALGAGGVMFKLRGGEGDGLPLDWSGLNLQASQKAQDAIITLDLPSVQPLLAGSSSVSGLPLLLQRALAQSGDWTPGPGAPMPAAIREMALRGPFDGAAGPDLISFGPAARPLNPGEEEIVIPMPLWAQMGRGHLSETDQIMGSPLAPAGYSPPMGVYRLVVPAGGPVDMTGGAPNGTSGIVELAGPTGLEIALQKRTNTVLASSLGGRQIIARVALDDGESVVTRRGRIRVGAPLSAQDLGPQDPSSDTVLSQGGGAPDSAPTVVAQPRAPAVDVPPSGTFIDGSFTGADSAASVTGPSSGSSMAGALTSAMQMSADVDARTSMPGRPSIGQGTSSSPAVTSDSSGFSSRAQAAGEQSAAGSAPSVSSAGGGATGASALASGGSNQTLVATALEGSIVGVQAGSAISDMTSASSGAAKASSSASSRSSSAGGAPSAFITELQPGMWSGHRRNDTFGYQSWSYGSNREDRPQSVGGVDLASLSRPVYPSLPTSLRFRYVGAPLWWSGSTASGGIGMADDDGETDSAPANRAMRAGLRAATSAASIWRSILVAGPKWGGPNDDLSGGMDSGHDAAAGEMSSLAGKFDALTAASLVGAGGVAGAAAGGGAYIGVSGSGSAGTLSKAQAARARASAVEMSIVAAIPPAPPPLENMGSGATGGNAPHARGKGHGHHGHKEKENAEAVSHSKIEGSVDAIAQRIYHRIRRRIQSDRERFGG
ncbi:MAG: hypothetical protein E6J88_19085 [Deltaproteobacteria bacterium]|nr:MAG: hypothetical protein E6J88_19085 [Deltaproteobacteria bacterium]